MTYSVINVRLSIRLSKIDAVTENRYIGKNTNKPLEQLMHPELDPNDENTRKIIQETALIPWQELQRFFAAGQAIEVSKDIDLIYVAKQFSDDNATAIKTWMDNGQVQPVSDKSAAHWFEMNTSVWATVVLPWVLVQDKSEQNNVTEEKP